MNQQQFPTSGNREGSDDVFSDQPPSTLQAQLKQSPRGFPLVAWGVIALCCFLIIADHMTPERQSASGEDRLGIVLTELQGRYMVGARDLPGIKPEALYDQSEQLLNSGSFDQRVRFVVLANELMGLEEARNQFQQLQSDVAQAQAEDRTTPFQLSADQRALLDALHVLYADEQVAGDAVELDGDTDAGASADPGAGADAGAGAGAGAVAVAGQASQDAVNVDALSDAQRKLLIDELDWYGRLALAPPGTADQRARSEAMAPAKATLTFIVSLFAVLGLLAIVGFVALVVLIVLFFNRSLAGGLARSQVGHGIYAETFAAWMVLFLGLQVVAGELAGLVPNVAMFMMLGAFFASLLALLWPVVRGVSWRQVRADIGWSSGRGGALEPFMGLAGYVTGLPVLGIGLGITLALTQLQEKVKVPRPLFEPNTGPAHPIIAQLDSDNWLLIISVLAVGVIAAPIVEETMFRGVLYRHLRDASRPIGSIASFLLSAAINSFIFAIIHPQGWLAVPALMALALVFSMLREWRGSVIPAMVAHGLSNFLVLSILLVLLRLD